jgi:hypothetical protein
MLPHHIEHTFDMQGPRFRKSPGARVQPSALQEEVASLLYTLVKYLHVASVLGFVGLHGISAWTAWVIKGERDPARIAWVASLSASTVNVIYGVLGFVLATGVLAGFMGHWWGTRWIWAAIVVLLLMIGAMGFLSEDYRKLRVAAGLPRIAGQKGPPPPPSTPDVIIATASATRASLITTVGILGLLIILWLMIFKPF